MSDRELLEMAAKAVGMPPPWDDNDIFCAWVGEIEHGHWWDPLADGRDALSLAASLHLEVRFLDGFKQVQCRRYEDLDNFKMYGIVGYGEGTAIEPSQSNVCAAIVIAAAKIGRSMP